MQISEIKTLQDVAREYSIPFPTLQSRLKHLQEGIDYKRLGQRQSTILSPQGIKKIVKGGSKNG